MVDKDINQNYQENVFIVIKKDIWKRIVSKEGNGKNIKNEDGEASMATNFDRYESYDVLIVLTNPSRPKWICDSGCSFHISHQDLNGSMISKMMKVERLYYVTTKLVRFFIHNLLKSRCLIVTIECCKI